MAQIAPQTAPNTGVAKIDENSTGQITRMNNHIVAFDALIQSNVIDRNLTAPPGSPSDGDVYIPAATATGDWAGKEDDIAYYDGNGWQFFTPSNGWRAFIVDEAVHSQFNGSSWASDPLGGGSAAQTLTWSNKTASFSAVHATADAHTIDCTSGDVTVTLPVVASSSGQTFKLKRKDASANDVIIDGNGSETIDGNLTVNIISQYDCLTVSCDGTEWWII